MRQRNIFSNTWRCGADCLYNLLTICHIDQVKSWRGKGICSAKSKVSKNRPKLTHAYSSHQPFKFSCGFFFFFSIHGLIHSFLNIQHNQWQETHSPLFIYNYLPLIIFVVLMNSRRINLLNNIESNLKTS